MDYRIFNMCTDVNACDCTWGCTDTVRECTALGNQTCIGGMLVLYSTNGVTSPFCVHTRGKKSCVLKAILLRNSLLRKPAWQGHENWNDVDCVDRWIFSRPTASCHRFCWITTQRRTAWLWPVPAPSRSTCFWPQQPCASPCRDATENPQLLDVDGCIPKMAMAHSERSKSREVVIKDKWCHPPPHLTY